MYEVTYSVDGILKKVNISANDALQAQSVFTNMYSSGNVQIINIVRKWEKIMEEEIEEKLEKIYTPFVKVKFRDFGIYDVYLNLNPQNMIAIVFKYDAKMTLESNLTNIQNKLDREIVKAFKKISY